MNGYTINVSSNGVHLFTTQCEPDFEKAKAVAVMLDKLLVGCVVSVTEWEESGHEYPLYLFSK